MLLTESYYAWIQLDLGQTGPERRKQIRPRKTRDDSFRHGWEGSLLGHVALWLGDVIYKQTLRSSFCEATADAITSVLIDTGSVTGAYSHLFPTSMF